MSKRRFVTRPGPRLLSVCALLLSACDEPEIDRFGPQRVVSTATDGSISLFAADVDGDGDLDMLSASGQNGEADEVSWYENTDGAGSFGAQQAISHLATGASSVFGADVDGDGDVDVLTASSDDDKIAWYENADGAGHFGAQQVISTLADGATAVFGADVDGDGDVDVLSASFQDDKIAWYENTDGAGSFGTQQVISTSVDLPVAIFAADVDGDGDPDVLAASQNDNKIVWYENTDGAGGFGEQQVISKAAIGAQSVFAADVDGDGDLDVLSASARDDKIAWYENTDGAGRFGAQQVISLMADGASSVFGADFDRDGDIDVLSASFLDDKIAWYENKDGAGSFGAQQVISTEAAGAEGALAADLDGDGDPDVLSASGRDHKIAVYENADGASSFGSQQAAATAAFNKRQVQQARLTDPQLRTAKSRPFSVFGADLDGDGDLDVLSAFQMSGEIAWYENADGTGNFGTQRVISTQADGATSVFAADVDGDGDLDVLSASSANNKIAWYENTDGEGSFGAQQLVTAAAGSAQSVFAADLDGDGDADILFAQGLPNKIVRSENINGAGKFGMQRVVSTEVDQARSVFGADLDGDGDLDALSASAQDNKIAWYENTDGLGKFGPQRVISIAAIRAAAVFAADLDGDGDADVLSASRRDNKIAWYENTDGGGSFGAQRVISAAAHDARSVFAADVDGDGDLDVLSASFLDDKIAWYENTDGSGEFGIQQVISSEANGAASVFAADVDGDGDLDVLSASADADAIAWHENIDGAGSFGALQAISVVAPHGAGSNLIEAAQNGRTKTVLAMLADGADANERGEGGTTPMMVAAAGNHREAMDALIASGANVNARDEAGRSVLIRAIDLGVITERYTDIINLLLHNGADVNVPDGEGITALMHVAGGPTEWHLMKLKNGTFMSVGPPGSHSFLEGVYFKVVKALLTKDADVNARDTNGQSALMRAASAGFTKVAQTLIDAGADVNLEQNNGGTALGYAAGRGSLQTVQALLSNGADVNVQTSDGWTALFFATLEGHTDIVRTLVRAGANVNARLEDGASPLLIAAREGHTRIVKVLLAAEVEVEAADRRGDTALIYATRAGHIEIIELLKEATAVSDESR